MKTYPFAFVLILVTVALFAQPQKSPLPLPDSGDVTLPLDEYNKLLELASRPVKKPDIAPQNFSIKCADLKFRADGSSVVGSVQLEGEVFKKGVIKVPLVKGMTTFDAKQDGKSPAAPLQAVTQLLKPLWSRANPPASGGHRVKPHFRLLPRQCASLRT